MIESNEMIDMRMRDEDLVDALYLPRRQRGDFPEIEQQTVPFEQRLHIDCGVAVAAVDQAGMEKRPHGELFPAANFQRIVANNVNNAVHLGRQTGMLCNADAGGYRFSIHRSVA